MRVVLSSTDLSLIESAQVALDAQGIDSVVSGNNLSGLPSSPATLAVDEREVERALAILRDLQRTPRAYSGEAPSASRAFLLVIIILVVALCGTIIF